MKLFWKLFLEFIPLGLLFVFTTTHDIYVGTIVMMVATVVSVWLVWRIYNKVAMMAIITAVTSLGAGGMTLWLSDPMWVKMKPTLVSGLFAAILLGGWAVNRPLLKPLVGLDVHITDEGWMAITLRWGLYFVIIAVLNEVVWRGANLIWPPTEIGMHSSPMADEVWAGFKAFALMPLTILYAVTQVSLLRRYRTANAEHDGLIDRIADYFDMAPKAVKTKPPVPVTGKHGT
jgi:intracellular septation protein